MNIKRTIGPAQDTRNEKLLQQILSMSEDELNAIFDSSPFYQQKMAQAIKDLSSVKNWETFQQEGQTKIEK